MHSSESHFKLLVWVGVCTGAAVDTDKWLRRRAVLEPGRHISPLQARTGNLFGSRNISNLYVVDEHQGYTGHPPLKIHVLLFPSVGGYYEYC